MDEKVISNAIHKDVGINGKTRNSVLEVVSTEESEDEKLIDLDSDEVDCTIIEDDIDLEELMKQKVRSYKVRARPSFFDRLYLTRCIMSRV